MNDINELKEALPGTKDFLEEMCGIKTEGNKAHHCPLCGSGTKMNKTSAFFVYDSAYKCYSCDFWGDQITLYMAYNGVDFADTVARLCQEYNIEDVNFTPTKKKKLFDVQEDGDNYKIILYGGEIA